MDQNPYRDGKERAGEYLRQAIKLLADNNIPISPLHYRMGYDYIAGSNNVLKAALDDSAQQPGRPLTEYLWTAYQRAYVHNDETLDAIRQGLTNIITGIQRDLGQSEGKLSGYANRLNQFASILHKPSSPQAMATEVVKVIEATRDTEQSQRQFTAQIDHLATEVAALRKELAQVREESLTDALTTVSNRKAFDMALEEIIQRARNDSSTFCLVIADIDHFKQVNDRYGHVIGDKVLRFVAAAIKRSVKGRDLVARIGGEEFAIILANIDLTSAYTVAEQIREAVFSGIIKDMQSNRVFDRVTISLGVAQFVQSDLASDLLRRADAALYLAKERGRNRVEKEYAK